VSRYLVTSSPRTDMNYIARCLVYSYSSNKNAIRLYRFSCSENELRLQFHAISITEGWFKDGLRDKWPKFQTCRVSLTRCIAVVNWTAIEWTMPKAFRLFARSFYRDVPHTRPPCNYANLSLSIHKRDHLAPRTHACDAR